MHAAIGKGGSHEIETLNLRLARAYHRGGE